MKRTHQPKKKRTKRKSGFRSRMKSKAGQRIIKRRRKKGRKQLAK
ncbi:MAG: 50S ribosomal protein L34 [Armatimonadota bacterium]|nr:50S ribosomal protein L34 [Armatimonadota bacterium]